MLGVQYVDGLALLEQGRGEARHVGRGDHVRPFGRALVEKRQVAQVVNQCGEMHGVDGFEGDGLNLEVVDTVRGQSGEAFGSGSGLVAHGLSPFRNARQYR